MTLDEYSWIHHTFLGEIGSLYVVLAGLELAGIFLPLPPVLGVIGICHHGQLRIIVWIFLSTF